jgi:hypothetical protein
MELYRLPPEFAFDVIRGLQPYFENPQRPTAAIPMELKVINFYCFILLVALY